MTNEADTPQARGFFKRLRAKLNQGPAWLTTDLAELLPGRKIDADILDELEMRLITADVGAEATARILGDLRKRVARSDARVVAPVATPSSITIAVRPPISARSRPPRLQFAPALILLENRFPLFGPLL